MIYYFFCNHCDSWFVAARIWILGRSHPQHQLPFLSQDPYADIIVEFTLTYCFPNNQSMLVLSYSFFTYPVDLKAFERRLTEVIASLQPATGRWRSKFSAWKHVMYIIRQNCYVSQSLVEVTVADLHLLKWWSTSLTSCYSRVGCPTWLLFNILTWYIGFSKNLICCYHLWSKPIFAK